MRRIGCAEHVWLITSGGQSRGEPTVRVKCWRCFKRGRWPVQRISLARGMWKQWEERSKSSTSPPAR